MGALTDLARLVIGGHLQLDALAVHQGDVLGGMVFGILAGFAGYWIVKLLEAKLSGRKNAGNQIRG